MKKTKLKKVSKQPISKIQRELWKECRRVADILYKPDCYTCPAKNLTGSNKQLGHVPYPKSTLGANLKYDMRVLRWQCFACNIHKGGMGAEAYKRMLKEEGWAFMEQLEKDKQKTVKAYDEYLELLKTYRTYEK
jgi:predicted transcriptional regulator